MAIKEQRRYFNQPIGVVKANLLDEGVARNLNSLADNLIQSSFQALVEDARQKGTDIANAASQASLRTINPETGEPESFVPPAQFGRQASKAYQSVIERRYVKATEQDLKLQSAKIFAEEFEKPNGFQLYSDRMRSSFEKTVENALPRFKNIVGDIGASLIASTEIEFIKRDQERNKELLATAVQMDTDQEASEIRSLALATDFNNPEQVSLLLGALSGNFQSKYDAYNANIINVESLSEQENKLMQGFAIGLEQKLYSIIQNSRLNKKQIGSSDVLQAQSVIKSGGVGFDDLDERIQPLVKSALELKVNLNVIGTDGKLTEIEKDYTNILSASVIESLSDAFSNASQLESDEKNATTELEKQELHSYRLNLTTAIPDTVNKIANTLSQGNIAQANVVYNLAVNEIKNAPEGTAVSTIQDGLTSLRRAFSDALIDRMYQTNISVKDSKNIDRYINGQEGGITLEQLPTNIQPLMKQLDDIKSPLDNDDLRRTSSAKFQNVNQQFTLQKNAIEDAQNWNTALSGASVGDSANRKLADKAMNIAQPNYMLSDEGFPNLPNLADTYVKIGYVGENLKTTAEVIFEGRQQISPEDIVRFYAGWDLLSNKATESGSTMSPWMNSGLSDDAFEFHNLVNDIVKNSEGTLEAPVVYQRMKDALSFQNKDNFNEQIQKVTDGKGIELFLEDQLENNNRAVEYFRPIMKYYVAGDLTKEQIKERIQNSYDNNWQYTEGTVVDPMNSSDSPIKSQFSLTKFIPRRSDRQQVITNVNKYLQSVGVNVYLVREEDSARGAFFGGLTGLFTGQEGVQKNLNTLYRADAGVPKDAEIGHLVPIQGEATGSQDDIIYQLYTKTESGLKPVPKTNGEFIYLSLRQMKQSIVQPQTMEELMSQMNRNDFLEMKRNEMLIQGTADPLINPDVLDGTATMGSLFQPESSFTMTIEDQDFNDWVKSQNGS